MLPDDTIVLSRGLAPHIRTCSPVASFRDKPTTKTQVAIDKSENKTIFNLPDELLSVILNKLDKYDSGKISLYQQSRLGRENFTVLHHAFPAFVKSIYNSKKLHPLHKTMEIGRFIPRLKKLGRDLRIDAIEPLNRYSDMFSDIEFEHLLLQILPNLEGLRPNELTSGIETAFLATRMIPSHLRANYLDSLLHHIERSKFAPSKVISSENESKKNCIVDAKVRLLEISISSLRDLKADDRLPSLQFISRLTNSIPDSNILNILSMMLIFVDEKHSEILNPSVKEIWNRTRQISNQDTHNRVDIDKHLIAYLNHISKLPKSLISESSKDALDARQYHDEELSKAIFVAKNTLEFVPLESRLDALHGFFSGISTRSFDNDHWARFDLAKSDVYFPKDQRRAVREQLSKYVPIIADDGTVQLNTNLQNMLAGYQQPTRDMVHLLYMNRLSAIRQA